MNKDMTQLTLGERLWIERHRLGETQAQAARRYGCARTTYLDAELDRRNRTMFWPRTGTPHLLDAVLPRTATMAEALRLARRRRWATMADAADAIGVSRATLLTWEKAGHMELVLYWERLGWSVAMKDSVDA